MSEVPFQVKEFVPVPVYGEHRVISIAEQMNEWFAVVAADAEHEYDIRQILTVQELGWRNVREKVLVFFEVTPAQ